MEYTKDMTFNLKYTNDIEKIKDKKRKIKNKIIYILKKNKFIITVLVILVNLIILDVILVNSFINILNML